MLSFFKSNNPAVVIFYVLYLLLFRICFAISGAAPDFATAAHSEPLSQWLFGLLERFGQNYRLISICFAALLCFLQALLVNNIVNNNRILPRKNYMAGALFIIFSSFFPSGLFLSPASIALTFIILATDRIFSLIKKDKLYGDVFDTGFLVALATLFYFPCVVFVVFVYIGLATVRAFNYREWTIAFLGFLSPIFLVFTWYFWHDKTALLLTEIANIQPGGWLQMPKIAMVDKVMLGGIIVVSAVCLTLLPGALYSSLIQVRKFANTLVVQMVIVLVAILLQQTVQLSHLVFFALPLGVISAMVLMQIKRGWISEVIHLILILLVLSGQYLQLFNIN